MRQLVANLKSRVLPFVVAYLGIIATVAGACAQQYSPYSEFAGMSVSDLDALQIKLTDVSQIRTSDMHSLLLHSLTAGPAPEVFSPYRRAGWDYGNDDIPVIPVAVSNAILKAIIDAIAAVPDVTDGGEDEDGWLAFSMTNTIGGATKAFDSILNSTSASALAAQLYQGLDSNKGAQSDVQSYLCLLGMLDGSPMAEFTSSTGVEYSGMRIDRADSAYIGSIEVENTSGSALQAPILAVIKILTPEVTLLNSDGYTCLTTPPTPYVELMPSGTFLPGQKITKVLRFENTDLATIETSVQIFAGPGIP